MAPDINGEFYFIRATFGQDVSLRFLITVIFTSREEAETALKAEYARHESFGYAHEIIHVSEVTQQELERTIRIHRNACLSPADTLFMAFWKGRSPIPMDPITAAVYAVASGKLRPDTAVQEIMRHYGIPVALAAPGSSVRPSPN